MKKIILVLAVLMLAAPAFGAAVTITATQEGSTKEVTISYGTSGQLPRAFALDITVDNGKVIEDVTDFFTGECNDSNGYGIFPASFAREIDADDPNWADVNYTPVADVNDLPGGTEGGKGTPGVTIEMGSLYDASKGKGPPESSGTLCSIWVSGDCNVGFAVNVGRAGVVMEDGNDANSPPHSLVLIGCHVTLEEICTVPFVVGDTNAVAQAAIIAEGFTVGNITTTYTDCSQPAGDVTSQSPLGGTTPGCETAVDIVVRGVCDGDLTCDGWVNAADETDISNYIVTYGGFLKAVPHTHANWDPKYDFNVDNWVNSQDETDLSNYIVNYGGFLKAVNCTGAPSGP